MRVIVPFVILLFVVGINYGCMKLAIKNPSIISGFKMSNEPRQYELDKSWLELLFKYMRCANIVTLLGGLVGIVCGLQILYYVSLILPISLAVLLAYRQRRIVVGCKGKKSVASIAVFLVIILGSLPLIYVFQSDLKVHFSNDKMEITGLYGRDISLSDVNKVEFCQSLPHINFKTNGFALSKTRLGNFRTKDGDPIVLFTHSDKDFVRITLKDGTIFYLSYKNEKATKRLWQKIQNIIDGKSKNGY